MNEITNYIKKLPYKWARNGFILGLLWVMPFVILGYMDNQKMEGGPIGASIRILSTIIMPLTLLGLYWGTLEKINLYKILNNSIENNELNIPKYYLTRKIFEGALVGFLYAIIFAFVEFIVNKKIYDPIYIYNHASPNFITIIFGCFIGCIISYVMKRKLIRLFTVAEFNIVNLNADAK